MTSHTSKGRFEITCDGPRCHEFVEGRAGDFGEVWGEAKREGWTVKRERELWLHYCPSCSRPPKPDMKRILGDL